MLNMIALEYRKWFGNIKDDILHLLDGFKWVKPAGLMYGKTQSSRQEISHLRL